MIVNLNKIKSINIQKLNAVPFQLGTFNQGNEEKKHGKLYTLYHIINKIKPLKINEKEM